MAGFNKYYYLEGIRRGRPEANEMHLKDFLKVFFKRCHIDYNPYEQDIVDCWLGLTGNFIRQYTRKIYVADNVLYVQLSSSVAKAELLLVKEALKNKINRDLGQEVLKDIVLR